MKEKSPRKIWIYIMETVIFAVADILILLGFLIFLTDILKDIVGLDYVELENWYGTIENPIRCRFGIGCCQYTFELIKFVVMIVLHKRLITVHKETSKRLIAPVIIHVILLGVGMFLVTRGGYGWLALGMFKDMLTGFGG